MPRIPLPPTQDPRSIQGDRLNQQSGDGFSAPGRALASLGGELSQLATKFQNENSKIEEYNTNLALEKWTNEQAEAYQTELSSSAPDGSDFLPNREKNLAKSFAAVEKGIRNPEHKQKARLVFERTRGTQTLNGMSAVSNRRKYYVTTTTRLGLEKAVNTGQIQTEEQFQDYFNTVVKPKIDTYITDPIEREVQYASLGAELGKAYLEKNPGRVLPKRGSLSRDLDDTGQVAFLAERGIGNEAKADRVARLNPTFRNRLTNAIRDAEKATGSKAVIRSAYRSHEEQAAAYARYQRGEGGLAAPPGKSRHQHGIAADINDGPVLAWLHKNAERYGLSFLKGNAFKNDTGHIQISDDDRNMTVPDVVMEKPNTGIWQYVAPDEWDKAVTKAERIEADHKKEVEAAKKQAVDDTVKEGYDLIAGDTLNAEWIEDNRETLTPALYGTFQKALERQTNAVGDSDNEVYRTMFDRAVKDPDQDTVQDDAFQMFSDGQLKKSDFNRIFNLSRSTQRGKEKPHIGEIRKTLAARLAPLDREDTEQYEKRLDGLFALDDWISQNPNANRDEVKKKANEIAKEYTEGVDLRAGLDMPLYSSVGRYNFTADSLQVAAQKLGAAYKAKKITAEELAREATLLRKWKSVLDEEGRNGTKP